MDLIRQFLRADMTVDRAETQEFAVRDCGSRPGVGRRSDAGGPVEGVFPDAGDVQGECVGGIGHYLGIPGGGNDLFLIHRPQNGAAAPLGGGRQFHRPECMARQQTKDL